MTFFDLLTSFNLSGFSKSQHGEEAFPPGVPAPRLSIVAATQALPNVIGNRLQHQNGQPNQAQAAIQAAAAAFMMSNSLNSSNSDTSPEAKKLKTDTEGSELLDATIEEW